MTRVCYVIPTLNVGGTERQLVYLVKELSRDHAIRVVCTREAGALGPEIKQYGADIEELHLCGGWDPRQSNRLRKAYRAFQPDIVHTFLFGFDYAANRAARACGAKAIVSSRRELATWMRPRHLRAQRKANALADCIVANSEAVARYAQDMEQSAESLYRVIPNGIDVSSFTQGPDRESARKENALPLDKHVIGAVANLSPVKDYPLFLAVANELLRRRSDLHFVIVGDGPLRNWLTERISAPHWSDRFTHISDKTGVAPLLSAMDVLLHCSKSEGFPNAVMEAMASGTPVVAAAVGGMPELISDRVHGRLISSRSPSDYADAIMHLLDHPEDRAALIRNASARVRGNFSSEKMANAYRRLYAELLAANRSGDR